MIKKIFALVAALSIAFGAAAEFRWGPTAGLNVSSFFWKQKLCKTTQLAGFQAGIMGEVMIPGIGFGIDMALKYHLNGATVNFGEHEVWASDGIGNQKVWMHTLEIPLNLRFKWTRMQGHERYIAPFVYGGPVFTFNVATNRQPALEHPAATIGLQCGLGGEIFEKFQVSAGYVWDVSYQIRTKKLDNYSARAQGWLLNVAYLF